MNKKEVKENFKANLSLLRKIANGEKFEAVETTVEPTAEVETTEEVVEEVETTEAKFVDANLVDGTVISVEPDIELGAAVAIEGEAAPDGEYELADGSKIIVTGGIISEIPEAEAEEEVVEEEAEEEMEVAPVAESAPAREAKVEITRTEVEKKFEAQAAKIAELESKLLEFTAQREELAEAVVDAVESVQKEPSAEPTKRRNRNAFMKAEPTLEEKLDRIKKFKKSKNN